MGGAAQTRGRSIAIVGMACRYPGASDLTQFWSQIVEGRDAFRPIGGDRWAHQRFLAPPGRAGSRVPNTTPTTHAAWIDDVDQFAALHFGISPRRAEAMDPQQRLMLEVAREALADAGLEGRPFDRDTSAVYVGTSVSEYSRVMVSGVRARQMGAGDFGAAADQAEELTRGIAPFRPYTIPGSMLSMCASVVSQAYDLRGPSVALDTACASSLVAVAMASQHLRALGPAAGPSPIAMAGGVYLNLVPDNLVGFSRIGVLARAQCRPFDADAEGFILGEGAGVVVLKLLDDALRDGDRIYAVLRGTAWNSDGRVDGPMTPLRSGQAAVLRAVLDDAQVDPRSIDYIECHGTATAVGDAIELGALSDVLPARRSPPLLGTIKANIGHSLTAAGVAGLLRAALAVYHRVLPPQVGFRRWHPSLEPFAARFEISTAARAWDRAQRRALVDSFGFGGINCAALIEQAPGARATPLPRVPLLFCCSAPSPALLDQWLASVEQALHTQDLGSVAYTVTVTRALHPWVALFTATTRDEAARLLRMARVGLEPPPERMTWVRKGLLVGPRSTCEGLEAPPGLLAQGVAWIADRPVELPRHYPPPARRIADLPAVPLERGRYWIVDRSAGAAPATSDSGPRTDQKSLLARVADALAEVTGTPPHAVRPEHRLDQHLGIDSLMASELMVALARRFGVAVSARVLSERPTVAVLAQAVEAALRQPSAWIIRPEQLAGRTVLPLSLALEAMARGLDLRPPFCLSAVARPRLVRVDRPQLVSLERDDALAWLRASDGRIALRARVASPGSPPQDGDGTSVRYTSVPPEDGRPSWHLDPGLIEASLAALGNVLVRSIEAVSVVGTLTGELEVHLIPRSTMCWDALWLRGGEIIGWMAGIRVRALRTRAHRRRDPLDGIEGVRDLEKRLQAARREGLENPYFSVHRGEPGVRPQVDGRPMLSFTRYDYLGLGAHPEIEQAAIEAIRSHGTSASASRLIGGERDVHGALENALAETLGTEAAVAMVSGHATNVTSIGRLVGPGDLVVYDALSHDSLVQGALASRAARRAFPHGDVEALRHLVATLRASYRRVLIVTESVYSMDGDVCDLDGHLAVRDDHDCMLMIDEAHALGVLGARGRGLAEHCGVDPTRVDVWMGTLSKTLVSCGGYIAGSARLVRYLKYAAPGFVYSVGMPPSSAAAALAALGVLRREPQRVELLRTRAKFFRACLHERGISCGGEVDVPVVPVMVGDSDRCLALSSALRARGVEVMPILYPAVAPDAARLRFFVTCAHSEEDLVEAAEAVGAVLGGQRNPSLV